MNTKCQIFVKALSKSELGDLIGCLGRGVDENNITGELLGECLAEAVERLKNEEPRIKNQEG